MKEVSPAGPAAPGLLAVVIALGALLRLGQLSRPLDYDEAFTFLNFAAVGLTEGLSDYSSPNNHLFHTGLVHLSVALFGDAPWAVRLPAFIAGTLLIPWTYLLASRFHGPGAGLIAALIVSLAPYLVDYSTSARGYSLIAWLGCVILLAADDARTRMTRGPWVTMVTAGALALYTIPTMIYSVLGTLTWLALSDRMRMESQRTPFLGRRIAGAALAIAAVTALLYAPVIRESGLASIVSNRFVKRLALSEFCRRFPASLIEVGTDWSLDLNGLLGLLVALGLASAAAARFRDGATREPSPLGVTLLISLTVVTLQSVVPYPRTWIFLFPMVASAAAGGLGGAVWAPSGPLRRFGRDGILVLGIIALQLVPSAKAVGRRTHSPDDTSTLSVAVARHLRPGDLVSSHSRWITPVRYGLRRRGIVLSWVSGTWELETWQWPRVAPPGQPLKSPATVRWLLIGHASSPSTFETPLALMRRSQPRARLRSLERVGRFELLVID